MRCLRSSPSKVDVNQAVVLAASLLSEIRNQDVVKPEINVSDLYNYLTGRENCVDASKLENALDYWTKEMAKFRQPTQRDIEIFTLLHMKNKEYELAQSQARVAAQELAECKRSLGGGQSGSSPLEREQRAALLSEQSELAGRIVEKMKSEEGWTLNDIKDDYARMAEICKSLLLPKPIHIDSQSLLVAHLNNYQCKEEVERIRQEAIALLYSEEGQALNYVLPINRDQICLQLNIDDPTVKVDSNVRYLLENESKLNAQILCELREREAAFNKRK